LTPALTLTLSPKEREQAALAFSFPADLPAHPAVSMTQDAGNVKALSRGRGLGEGGRSPIRAATQKGLVTTQKVFVTT